MTKKMSTKRPHEETSDEKTGFVHNVSPIKRSKNNTTYFNGSFQTENSVLPLVCFSPEKHHAPFTNAQKRKTPVKIRKLRTVSGRMGTEVHINRLTTLEVLPSLSFTARNLELQLEASGSSEEITQICNLPHQNNFTCNIKGKVLKINATEIVQLHTLNKTVQEIGLSDNSGNINIAVWEDQVDTLQTEKSYIFNKVQTRLYHNVLKLTSCPETTIHVTDDITVDEIFAKTTSHKLIGSIDHIQCLLKKKCLSCNKPIANITLSEVNVRCPSCKLKMKTIALHKQMTARVGFTDHNTKKIYRLCIFHNVLQEYCTKSSPQLLPLLDDPEGMEDHFLSLEQVTLFKSPAEDSVASIDQTTCLQTSQTPQESTQRLNIHQDVDNSQQEDIFTGEIDIDAL